MKGGPAPSSPALGRNGNEDISVSPSFGEVKYTIHLIIPDFILLSFDCELRSRILMSYEVRYGFLGTRPRERPNL